MNEELEQKIEFVEEMNKSIVGRVYGIKNIRYVVCVHKTLGFVEEYLEISYGEHKQVRNCTHNSFLAILDEITIMCRESCKYNDNEFLNRRLTDENWNIYAS